MNEARDYARLTDRVTTLIVREPDRERAARLIARAALLHIRAAHGSRVAADIAYALADELAVAR